MADNLVLSMGLLSTGAGGSLILLPDFEILSIPLGVLAQPRYESFHLVLLYLDLSCLALISWRSAAHTESRSG